MRLSYTEMEVLIHHLQQNVVGDGDQISPHTKLMLIRRGLLTSLNGNAWLTTEGKRVARSIRFKFRVMSHLRRLKSRFLSLKRRWSNK